MNMDYMVFERIARETVADYTNRAALDDVVSPNDVYIVWQCKTLQNWKALAAKHRCRMGCILRSPTTEIRANCIWTHTGRKPTR